MSQALIEFLALSVVIATLVVSWLQVRKANKALAESRATANLLRWEVTARGYEVSLYKAVSKDAKRELLEVIEWNAQLLQEIEVRKAQPLASLTDDQLVEAIRKEVEGRVSGKYLAWYATGETSDGQPFWKLASKVGGAAFRVVDKAKRGKLAVQDNHPGYTL